MDKYSTTGIYNHAKAAGSPKGIKRSRESVLKMVLAKRGKKASEETRKKMRDSQARIRELKSASAKAQWSRPGEIEKISLQRKGRVTSEETKKLLSQHMKERWESEEYKNKLSDKQKIAQKPLKEFKSENMKQKWSDPEFRKYMLEARARKKYNRLTN